MNSITHAGARRAPGGFMLSATTEEVSADGRRRPRRIPLAGVPLFPIGHMANFLSKGSGTYPCVADTGTPYFLEYGRQAIYAALAWRGIGPGDRVLLPAYHCQSMIDPVTALGAEPIFYRIAGGLQADIDDFSAKCRGAKAAIAVHYFGFPNCIADLAELCGNQSVFLIEDCAHAYFGLVDGRPVGSWGDVAVASPRKFFAAARGGLLVVPEGTDSGLVPARPGLRGELSAFVEFARRATRYGGFPLLKPVIRLIDGAEPEAADRWDDNGADRPASTLADSHVEPQRGFIVDRIAARSERASEIAEARRRNYRRLLAALGDVDGVEPLFADLPDNTVPFMLPLRISGLSSLFATLEDAALPMQRFGQFPSPLMPEDTCPLTSELAEDCIQLACHQGLRDEDIDWIAARLRGCVERTGERAQA